MLAGRKVLLLMVVPLLCGMAAGCQWLTLAAGTEAAYEVTATPATDRLTNLAHVEGSLYVGEAVKVWMDRGQLPLPVLEDGVHEFDIRPTKYVEMKGSLGARVVELWDRNRLVAEYVVSWDRRPEEYRLVSAQNKLYEGELDVSAVPVLKTNYVE